MGLPLLTQHRKRPFIDEQNQFSLVSESNCDRNISNLDGRRSHEFKHLARDARFADPMQVSSLLNPRPEIEILSSAALPRSMKAPDTLRQPFGADEVEYLRYWKRLKTGPKLDWRVIYADYKLQFPLSTRLLPSLQAKYYESFSKTPFSRPPRRPGMEYTVEEVDFIRYYKEDIGITYTEIKGRFEKQFPESSGRGSPDGFKVRLGRDNIAPQYQNGHVVRDAEGNVQWEKISAQNRVGDRSFKLLDMFPERAIEYEWVAPEHKVVAQKILDDRLK